MTFTGSLSDVYVKKAGPEHRDAIYLLLIWERAFYPNLFL